MTSIFLHGPGSWASIGPSERRAAIDKRGELVLRPEGAALPVFDDRVLDARQVSDAISTHKVVVTGRKTSPTRDRNYVAF
jgi:hypothetical protein